MRHSVSLILLTMTIVVSDAPRADAGGHCALCGCNAECNKACRVVYEEKKVEVVCWGSKCEEFCVPGCSKRGCKHCEMVCDFCDETQDSDAPSSSPKKFTWRDWVPGCARVYTKNKLMKKTIVKKVPAYKWVVEDLCSQCEAQSKSAQIPPGVQMPPQQLATPR